MKFQKMHVSVFIVSSHCMIVLFGNSFHDIVNAFELPFIQYHSVNPRRFPSARQGLGATAVNSASLSLSSSPIPIDPQGWPEKFPAKEHCSRCGLCETSFVANVTSACSFLNDGMSKIDTMEEQVHGRTRFSDMVWSSSSSSMTRTMVGMNSDAFRLAEEARFGVLHDPVRLAKGMNVKNAQWTGVVTGIALSMLEAGMVDAVVCIASDSGGDWATPEPILARTPDDVLRGRGVKPALAPSLNVLDDIQADPSIRKLLFCGVGCAVQAFRAIQADLTNLDEVYVMGTNCADNSPTPKAARNFIRNGVGIETDDTVLGYEFAQDFKVHIKTTDSYITKPYFTLPGTIAEPSIAKSCLACFDYTNALADVVVGYMGAPLTSGQGAKMDMSYQTLTVRNERGAKMVQVAVNASRLEVGEIATGSRSHERLATGTVTSDSIVLAMMGKPVPEVGMPVWMGELMAFGISSLGPKGVSFARYSIDYHVLRNYLHVVETWGVDRAKICLPRYARDIVDHYREHDEEFATLLSTVESKQRVKSRS
jgi:coenzyme F420-reducing hydrogenase beta subunit